MNKKNITFRLFKIVFKSNFLLILSVFMAILATGCNLLGPLLIGRCIDAMKGIQKVDFSKISITLFLIIGIYLLGNFSLWLLTIFTNKVAYHTSNSLRKLLFTKLATLPLKFYDTTSHGDTISRFINDADTVSDGLLQSISNFLTSLITIIGALLFMLSLSWWMTIIVLISAPVSFYVAKWISTQSSAYFKSQATLLGSLNGYAEEMLSHQKLICTFGYEETCLTNFSKLNTKLYTAGVKSQFYSSLTNPSTRLVNNLTYGMIGMIGVLAVIGGSLSIGNLSSFLLYSNIFSKPFNEITGVIPQLQAALASAHRIFSLLDEPEESSIDHHSCSNTLGEVNFNHVYFSYEPNKPLIKDFNLKVEPGTMVAIVGTTGAGKTTLINLLLRFYDITSGDITLDGTSIYSLQRDELRKNFGMVLQDTWLFKGTIKENIAYSNPLATDKDIVEAAKVSGAHSFIRRLPLGYDTPILGSADNLSSGQKQLLTITRVMLTHPSILILDEATSNIDTLTERHIQQAFTKMMRGKTSFIIAHRLSTIQEADLILVMDKGNIIEKGTHVELLAFGGHYTKLYHSQFSN